MVNIGPFVFGAITNAAFLPQLINFYKTAEAQPKRCRRNHHQKMRPTRLRQ